VQLIDCYLNVLSEVRIVVIITATLAPESTVQEETRIWGRPAVHCSNFLAFPGSFHSEIIIVNVKVMLASHACCPVVRFSLMLRPGCTIGGRSVQSHGRVI
jgi:hypothetical protein